jgi:hypothetical protein
LIDVFDHERNWRAGSDLFAAVLVGEYPGHYLHGIRFLPLGRETRLSGPSPIELTLDVFLFERNPWRTAVYHAADCRSVALAEAGEPEQMTESIERHGTSALRAFRSPRLRGGQSHRALKADFAREFRAFNKVLAGRAAFFEWLRRTV